MEMLKRTKETLSSLKIKRISASIKKMFFTSYTLNDMRFNRHLVIERTTFVTSSVIYHEDTSRR